MNLEDYLREKYPTLSWAAACEAFAERIDSTRQTVDRYARFLRFPSPEKIAAIRDETRNLVTADDHLPPRLREKTQRPRRAQA